MEAHSKDSKKTHETIIIALSQNPTSLDPRKTTDATGMRISGLIFQSLVRLDKNLKVQPWAASHWDYQNLTYTFRIPKNITFSNGRPLKKEDIEFSFDQYRSPQSPFYLSLKTIERIQVQTTSQEFILKIKLKEFSATFLNSDLIVIKLLPKKEILSSPEDFKDRPMGTGPFQLVQRNSNSLHLRLKDSWTSSGQGLLNQGEKIRNVVFKVIRDDLTRFQKVLRQEIDIVQSELPYSKIHILKKKKLPYNFFQTPGLSMNYILIQMKHPLLKQLKVRQALSLAIHRDEIIQHRFKNMVQPALSILSPQSFFSSKKISQIPYRPLQARKIVQELGLHQSPLSIKTSNNPAVVDYAKIIAYQLRQVGLKIQIQSYEWGTFYKDLSRGNFQMALMRWVGVNDPDIYRIAFHSSQVPPHGRNRGFYINKKLDLLLDQGRKENDPSKRYKTYEKIQKIIQSDQPIIPLWHHDQVALVHKDITGYFLPMNGSYDFLIP